MQPYMKKDMEIGWISRIAPISLMQLLFTFWSRMYFCEADKTLAIQDA